MKPNNATIIAAILLAVCIFTQSCTKTAPYQTVDGFAQGSTYHIIYQDPENRELRDSIDNLLNRFDKSLSIYNPTSLLSQVNTGDSTIVVDQWFEECFALSQQISQATDGMFDITLRPLIAAYGFGGKGEGRLLSQVEIDSMMNFVGFSKVGISQGRIVRQDPRIQLDFNAIAQGYSVDLLGRLFESIGIKNYMIEIGGEIFCLGVNSKGEPWKIGIDSPKEGNYTPGADLQTTIPLSGRGLATSGNYRKFAYTESGDKLTHTIDPRSGRPASHNLLSATLIAESAAIADGYATACMVIGFEKSVELLKANPSLDGYLIYADSLGNMKTYSTLK